MRIFIENSGEDKLAATEILLMLMCFMLYFVPFGHEVSSISRLTFLETYLSNYRRRNC